MDELIKMKPGGEHAFKARLIFSPLVMDELNDYIWMMYCGENCVISKIKVVQGLNVARI